MPVELEISRLSTLDLSEAHAAIDRLESELAANPDSFSDVPVMHRFTDGLYSRQVLMKKGQLIISEIHKTQHQFVILMGRIAVWTPETRSWTLYEAPEHGITSAGTRRVLCALEDTVWTTFHASPDNETNVQALEARLLDCSHRLEHYKLKADKLKELV